MARASLIPGAGVSVDRIDLAVDDWFDPEFSMTSKVGEYEIEDGTKITDHVTALPDSIKVTGLVDGVRSNADRAAEAWDTVRKLHQQGAIMRFVSEYGVWRECVIKSASTSQKTRGLEFTLSLQQIKRVPLGGGSSSTLAQALGDPNNPAGERQPEVETGIREPAPVEPGPVFFDGNQIVPGLLGGEDLTSEKVEIVDENGNPTGRFTIPKDDN